MLNRRDSRFSFPSQGWPLLALIALYLGAGLFGHDPWKADDATAIGVAWDMLTRGHWLAPHVGNLPYPDVPLYYWSAAGFGNLFSPFFPVHDGMRLASAFWTGMALFCLWHAGRELVGSDAGLCTVLAFAGSIGLVEHAHGAQPMLTGLAAHAAAYWALALLPRRPWKSALLLGLALAVAFLGSGLAVSLLLLPPLILALTLEREKRRAALALIAGLLLGVALILPWCFWLFYAEPDYFAQWWAKSTAQFGETRSFFNTAAAYLGMLSWFSWPAWPLAAWVLWIRRRTLLSRVYALPLGSFFLVWLFLSCTHEARPFLALLLLPPLAILAGPAVAVLRRGAANAFDWFGVMTFSFFSMLVWIGWSALVFGLPERLARQSVKLAPGFAAAFNGFDFAIAVLATVAWVALFLSSRPSPARGLMHWLAGMTTFWLLLTALWLPWVDYQKTYRGVSSLLATAWPASSGCLDTRSLSSSHLASFDYFDGILTTPGKSCDWLLTFGSSGVDEAAPGAGWTLIGEAHRPSDRSERFRLYRREP
ncbi:MAG: glycosyltransferase family 39 protein [Betaproteobacteria bacterium]|nr:glycosyltransferase family 39 protein [Betaproteobacteria bacterium]